MSLVCALHKTHEPRALTIEQHHVVPRAWQAVFVPSVPPYPGTYGGERLWDARLEPLAPTCHRNVHACIVAVMRWLAGHPGTFSAQTVSDAAALVARQLGAGRPTVAMAAQAPIRFMQAGGELQALFAAGEWGEA